MDQPNTGRQPELERLNYNELKAYIRDKGYDINLTQSADKLREEVKALEAGPVAEVETDTIKDAPYEVVGEFPKHPKLKEWFDSLANQYNIKKFQYNPKFGAFMLFRPEKLKRNQEGKAVWTPDATGEIRHFEWVSLRELAVTFGEADYPGAPNIHIKYQAPSTRAIKIKRFV